MITKYHCSCLCVVFGPYWCESARRNTFKYIPPATIFQQFSGDYKNSSEALPPLSEGTVISSEKEVTIKHLDPSEREQINEGQHEHLKADLG